MVNAQLILLLTSSLPIGLLTNALIQRLPLFLALKWQVELPGIAPARTGWVFTISTGCALFAAGGQNSLLHSALLMLVASILIALAFIDWQHQWLPDCLTLPLLWCGLTANLFALFAPLQEAVLGAMLGYLLLWCVDQIYQLLRGKPGIGRGDFKLLAALGAWVGWSLLPAILLLASGCALLFSLPLYSRQALSSRTPLAFGSYLATMGWLVLALRDHLVPIN